MGNNLRVNLSDSIKIKDGLVKANIDAVWDSNTLTLLGVLLSIALTFLFGIWSVTRSFQWGVMAGVLSFFLLVFLIRLRQMRNLLINFMRKILER